MAKISIAGDFNFDAEIGNDVAVSVIKTVIEKQFTPVIMSKGKVSPIHTSYSELTREIEERTEPEESEPP